MPSVVDLSNDADVFVVKVVKKIIYDAGFVVKLFPILRRRRHKCVWLLSGRVFVRACACCVRARACVLAVHVLRVGGLMIVWKMRQAGWVTKQGRVWKNWKERWLILIGSNMSYFQRGTHSCSMYTSCSELDCMQA